MQLDYHSIKHRYCNTTIFTTIRIGYSRLHTHKVILLCTLGRKVGRQRYIKYVIFCWKYHCWKPHKRGSNTLQYILWILDAKMVSTVNQYRTLFQDEPKKSKCIEYRYFFLLIEFVLKNVGEWLNIGLCKLWSSTLSIPNTDFLFYFKKSFCLIILVKDITLSFYLWVTFEDL